MKGFPVPRGESPPRGAVAPNQPYGRPLGKPVGIFVGGQGRFLQQAAPGKMGHQQPLESLPHQLRGLAAQHDPRPAPMGLELVQRPFDLPAWVRQQH